MNLPSLIRREVEAALDALEAGRELADPVYGFDDVAIGGVRAPCVWTRVDDPDRKEGSDA